MEQLEILERKVRQAAGQITALRKERDQLRAELQFLEQENKRARDFAKENEELREEKKTVAGRIQHVLRKIQSLKV